MFKSLFKCFMLVMLASATMLISSCGKDDEPDSTPEPEVAVHALVGTWRCIDSNGDSAVLRLNADHTGSITLTVASRVTVVATATETFNWNTSDDSSANHWFELIHTGGDYVFDEANYVYILAGNTLNLAGLVYTRIS